MEVLERRKRLMKHINDQAKEFVSKIEGFSTGISRARINFQKIFDRKGEAVKALGFLTKVEASAYSNSPEEFHKMSVESLKEFERVLKLEKKYTLYIIRELEDFKELAIEVQQSIAFNKIYDSVPKFIKLNDEYFSRLASCNKDITHMLLRLKSRNRSEMHHAKSAEGNIFTKDYIVKFIKEYKKIKKDEDEKNIDSKLDKIYRKLSGLENVENEIKDYYERLSKKGKSALALLFSGSFMPELLGVYGSSVVLIGGFSFLLFSGEPRKKRFYNIKNIRRN